MIFLLFFVVVLGGCIYWVYSMSAGAVGKAREPYRASLVALQREFGGQIVPRSGATELDAFGTAEQITVLVSGHGPLHDGAIAHQVYSAGGWYTMVQSACRGPIRSFVVDGTQPNVNDRGLWTPERLEMLRYVGPSTVTCGGSVVTVAFHGIVSDHSRLRSALYLVRSIAFQGVGA